MRLTIQNSARVLYQGASREVILPGADGDYSVMDFHQPAVFALRPGAVVFDTGKGKMRLDIKGGAARVMKNELMILI